MLLILLPASFVWECRWRGDNVPRNLAGVLTGCWKRKTADVYHQQTRNPIFLEREKEEFHLEKRRLFINAPLLLQMWYILKTLLAEIWQGRLDRRPEKARLTGKWRVIRTVWKSFRTQTGLRKAKTDNNGVKHKETMATISSPSSNIEERREQRRLKLAGTNGKRNCCSKDKENWQIDRNTQDNNNYKERKELQWRKHADKQRSV